MACGLYLSSPDTPQHFLGTPPPDPFVCTKQTSDVKIQRQWFLHHFISNCKCQTGWKSLSRNVNTFYYKILFYWSFSFWLIIGNYGCAPLMGLGLWRPCQSCRGCKKRSTQALQVAISVPQHSSLLVSAHWCSRLSNLLFHLSTA